MKIEKKNIMKYQKFIVVQRNEQKKIILYTLIHTFINYIVDFSKKQNKKYLYLKILNLMKMKNQNV